MKFCDKKGCGKLIKKRFRFCFQHKKEPYIDACKIHGKTSYIEGRCKKCMNMRKSVYRVHKKNGEYWIFNRKARKDHPLESYFHDLTYRNRRYAMRFVSSITKGPGTYGIFLKSNRAKSGLGKCLYVGQSVDVKRRIGEHRERIKEAKNMNSNVSFMYRELNHIGLKNIKFARLMGIPKRIYSKMNRDEALESLAILEQYSMDCFKPELNVVAARKTEIIAFNNKERNQL